MRNNFFYMGLGGGVQIRHCTPLSEERGVHLSPCTPLATGLPKHGLCWQILCTILYRFAAHLNQGGSSLYLNVMYRCAAHKNQGKQSTWQYYPHIWMYTCIDVPHTRTRGSSLPDNIAPAQLYRLRYLKQISLLIV